jgi:hypothetical protein
MRAGTDERIVYKSKSVDGRLRANTIAFITVELSVRRSFSSLTELSSFGESG